MHITELGFKNYRVFKQRSHVQLAPLTFLVGPNNSGKSSIIKLLLLLKDTFNHYQTKPFETHSPWNFFQTEYEDHNFPLSLIFDDNSHHHLGSFADILTKYSKNKAIEITLPFLFPEFKKSQHGTLELTYVLHSEDESHALKKLILKIGNTKILELIEIKPANSKYSLSINYSYLTGLLKKDDIYFIDSKEDEDEINYGYYKYEINSININGVDNQWDSADDTSAFNSFGTTSFSHLHKLARGRDLLFSLNKSQIFGKETGTEEEIKYEEALSNFEEAFLDESLSGDGMITFTGKKDFVRLPSIRKFLLDSFNDLLIKKYHAGDNKYNIGNFNRLNAIVVGRQTPAGVPINYSNYGTFLIGLLDRAIHFNLSLYTDTYSKLVVFPNLDLRYERLINENDGIIYNLLSQKLFSSDNSTYNHPDPIYPSLNFIRTVISTIGLGDDVSIKKYKDYGIEFNIINKGEVIPVKNFGYGIRKFLTLVLQIAAQAAEMSYQESDNEILWKPSILLLEEPESNLHPKLQSVLADLFVAASHNFNMQLIIETHSEYLIRKIQYLVAQKEDPVESKDVSIYYFNDPNESENTKCSLRRIDIRPDGILKEEFGTGFFDESLRLTMSLINLSKLN